MNEPDFLIPLTKWNQRGHLWPTTDGWYGMLRPERDRAELLKFGVVLIVNGRYLISEKNFLDWAHKNGHPTAQGTVYG